MDKITDLLTANEDLHLDRMFEKEAVPTIRIRKKVMVPATLEEVVDGEDGEKEKGEVVEEDDRQGAKTANKEMPPEFFSQRSISGARPCPVPCSYRICVANHNTRHTADR